MLAFHQVHRDRIKIKLSGIRDSNVDYTQKKPSKTQRRRIQYR